MNTNRRRIERTTLRRIDLCLRPYVRYLLAIGFLLVVSALLDLLPPLFLKGVVDVALPRPRHYTVKTTPEFAALKARLTDEIRAESIRAVEMEAR